MFNSKTLLITGGTGTFGNAILGCFLDTEIGEIRFFCETRKKQDDMGLAYTNPKLCFYLDDMRNPDSLYDVMMGVNYIFHTAALRQVHTCEFIRLEAPTYQLLYIA